MTFSGDLSGIHLADVFQNLNTNRQSGVLRVSGRGFEHFVRFEAGLVAGFSLGVGIGLPVSEHLVRRGYVTAAQLETALKKRSRSKKALRTVLAESKVLDELTFRAALNELVQERIYELISVREAQFAFDAGDAPPRIFDAEQSSAGIRLDPGALLMESARRKDELERIRNVVTSDDDLFVLLEGWDQFELDAIATEVAGLLDGRAPVSELLASLPYDPFFVKKAISDLVLQGLARPLLVQEMEDLARVAIDERRNVDAIAYLTRALKSERNHRGLREQLAEMLAAEGRHADAAAEYATLGFDVARDGDPDGALALYEKAVRLAPADLPLHERRVQLLAEVGDAETHLQAVFALANVMLDMALADRARQVLEAARGRRELKHRVDLVTKLAEVELALGRRSEAADLFTEAAERCVQTDRPQALSWLVRATECRPDDESLRRRYLELESGERERRRVRLRRRVGIAAVFAVLLAGATAGVVEILASNAVVSALASGLQSLGRGRTAEAVERLVEVERRYPMTPAGWRAAELLDTLVAVQIDAVERHLANGRHTEASVDLAALRAVLTRPDLDARFAALERRITAERHAGTVLERACRTLIPDEESLRLVAGLTDPDLLDFLLHCLGDRDRLARIPPRVRAALLDALSGIDSPRAFPVIARLHVANREPSVIDRTRRLLQTAERHRAASREDEWSAVYGELERAAATETSPGPATEALRLLRGR